MPHVYFYRRTSFGGLKALAVALGGTRFFGRYHPISEKVQAGDVIVCWGEALDPIPGVTILNGAPLRNPYQDALALALAGVPTLQVALEPPAAPEATTSPARLVYNDVIGAAEDFLGVSYAPHNPVFLDGVKSFAALITQLNTELRKPPAPLSTWLPRLFVHAGGADLLRPPPVADYWVKKETFVAEVCIHSFNGQTIRTGVKTPRLGALFHPWIRSSGGGWIVDYEAPERMIAQRGMAHAAVRALGLDFGAVNLGKTAAGKWLVLKVNRAPILDTDSVTTYTNAIKQGR